MFFINDTCGIGAWLSKRRSHSFLFALGQSTLTCKISLTIQIGWDIPFGNAVVPIDEVLGLKCPGDFGVFLSQVMGDAMACKTR